MLRLALMGGSDDASQYERIAARIRNGRFTAVVASDPRTARSTAESVGAEIRVDGFDELLAGHAGAFDAIVLHSPGKSQQQYCLLAAAAGKHVLAAMPLAHSRDAALRIISACREAGVRLMVAQASRFSPALQTVKESLDGGQLGDPGLVRIHSWKAAPDGGWQRAAEDSGQDSDRQRLLSGLVGEIDLACWLFGGRPDLVYALERNTSGPSSHDPDYVQLHLGFAGGGMALIDYTPSLPQGDGYFSLSLIGSSGAAYADDHRNMQLLYGGGRTAAIKVGEGEALRILQLQEFINSIEENRAPPVTGADALQVIDVAEAAAASLATGQPAQPGKSS